MARSPTAAPWVSGRRLHSPWSRLHRGGGCPSRLPKQQMLSGIILNENGPWSAGAVSFGVVSHRVCKCAVPVFGTGLNMVGTGSFLKTERPPERCSPIALTFGLFFVLAVALPLAFDLAGPSMELLLVLAVVVTVAAAVTAIISAIVSVPPAPTAFVFKGQRMRVK